MVRRPLGGCQELTVCWYAPLMSDQTPWRSLLDFVHLPEGCTVLCIGDDPRGMVQGLHQEGHRGLGLLEDATAESPVSGGAFLMGKPQALPLRCGALDAILCAGVLYRQENPEAVLEELRRALRPGGYLVIQEPLAEVGATGRYLSTDELCAHLAGEQLVVVAHRQEPTTSAVPLATWVLQVPGSQADKTRTCIEEDR